MRNGDIRNWVSPQRQPQQPQPAPDARPSPILQRRRRIIESDDSAEEQAIVNDVNPLRMPLPAPAEIIHQPENLAPHNQDIVLLESSESDDESDDMYVMNPRAQHPPQDPLPRLPRNRVQSGSSEPAGARRTPARDGAGVRRSRRQFEAVAAESSDDSSDANESSECIESDTNAQIQYREAIMGVRSARMARAQMRAATSHCPVCALFADYLAHFV
jgi:hypothetical protein